MLYRTLLIGLGGTGVEVLRRFKNHYVKYYDREQKYIKLLGIDTADQLASGDEELSAEEFLHLGQPPVAVRTILQYRNQPPFEWLPPDLPAFSIASGAGMRRLIGHMAYFWRGQEIVKRIEAAMQALYQTSVSRDFAGVAGGAQTRVFIVSSVCGGTGTGMFLDISYLVRQIFEQNGYEIVQFGLLFLPSTFTQLRASPDYRSISANGYAALQELDYYMQSTFQADRMPAPLPGGASEMIVSPRPFNLCFLVAGTDEAGRVISDSGELYRRTAEFLFSCVALPQIDGQLVSFFAFSLGAYCGFGSFSLALPRVRYIEKYVVGMGQELLADILDSSPSLASFAPIFAAEDQLRDPSRLAPIAEIDSRLNRDVFVHGDSADHSDASASIADEYRLWTDLKSALSNEIGTCAQAGAARLSQSVTQELDRLSAIDRGGLANRFGLLKAAVEWVDGVIASSSRLPAQTQPDASVLERYRQAPGLLSRVKPAQRLRDFRQDLSSAARAHLVSVAGEKLRGGLAPVRAGWAAQAAVLESVLSRREHLVAEFKVEAARYLEARRAETRSDQLQRAGIGEVSVSPEQYDTDRLGLLRKCRAAIKLQNLLSKDSLDLRRFVAAVYEQTAEYVLHHVAQSQLLDDVALREVGTKALVNLRLNPDPNAPPKAFNVVLSPPDQSVREQLKRALAPWTGSGPLQFPDGLDPSVVSFLRVLGGFRLRQIGEIEEMKKCYDERKRHPHESIFLDLPTHQRCEIWSANEGAEMTAVFARAVALGVIQEFGLNFLFDGRSLLPVEERDPVARRKAAYDRIFVADNRRSVTEAEQRKIRELGGNSGYARFLIEAIQRCYPITAASDPYTRMFAAERESLEDHLNALGVPGAMAVPGPSRQ